MKKNHLWVFHFFLLVFMAACLFLSSRQTSVTVDEFAHLPAGIKYWETGDFESYHHNPPLIRLLAAIPHRFSVVEKKFIEGESNRWALGGRFMADNTSNYHELFMKGRVVVIVLTLLTGVILSILVYSALGYLPSLVALLLFTFSPNMLAHGGLVTTDAGFCLAFLVVCYAGGRFFLKASYGWAVILGVLLGFAQLTKFSALFLYLLLIFVCFFGHFFCNRKDQGLFFKLSRKNRICKILVIIFISLIILNAGYLFQGTGTPLSHYSLLHPTFISLSDTVFGSIPCPFPEQFILGLDAQLEESSGAGEVYLFGKLYNHGWWFYYPLALILKLPLPLHFLLTFTFYLAIKGKLPTGLLFKSCTALCGLVLLPIIISSTNLNIGVRYLLFLFPFFYIIVAHLCCAEVIQNIKYRIFIGICLIWYCLSSLMSYPHYLSYFSEMVGGSGKGYQYLADSNLDWGQDLIHLKRTMDEKGIALVSLSHFGLVDPAVYGISYKPFDGENIRGQVVVVSINHLLGYHPFRQDIPSLEKLTKMKPTETIGHSLWMYDLREK